jgi:hypothetical protein
VPPRVIPEQAATIVKSTDFIGALKYNDLFLIHSSYIKAIEEMFLLKAEFFVSAVPFKSYGHLPYLLETGCTSSALAPSNASNLQNSIVGTVAKTSLEHRILCNISQREALDQSEIKIKSKT